MRFMTPHTDKHTHAASACTHTSHQQSPVSKDKEENAGDGDMA